MSSRLSSPQWLSNPTGFAMFVCGEASSVRVHLQCLHLSVGISDAIGEDASCFLEVLLACNISVLDKMTDAGTQPKFGICHDTFRGVHMHVYI